MKTNYSRWRRGGWGIALVLLVLAAFLLGRMAAPERAGTATAPEQGPRAAANDSATLYTCSMHPQVRSPNPKDKCPICGMDLIPVPADDGDGDEGDLPRLRLTERAAALLNIQTWPVERRAVQVPIRLYGRVEYDETGLRTIAAWAAGRLEQLLVDTTGVQVRRGDPMVRIYSPTLIEAQEALLQAVRGAQDLQGSGIPVIRETSQATLAAARERLRLLGLGTDQIQEIETRGRVADYLTIPAPVSGVVTERLATQGAYVETGQPIYILADLSRVWINLEVYEADLPWLALGQEAAFSLEAFPGELFQGRVAFIQPILDDRTRTVQVRIEVPNPEGRLRPGMFVRGVVRAEAGAVMPSPPPVQHVHQDPPALEMPAVPHSNESHEQPAHPTLPAAPEYDDDELPLLIPASAPLITGKRAVVYVRLPEADRPTFEAREVLLGPRAGDFYIVREGVSEGELVVTHGNFKIDSELQIRGRPSMMAPTGGPAPGHDHQAHPTAQGPSQKTALPKFDPIAVPPGFLHSLGPVYQHYLEAQRALADDNLAQFQSAAQAMQAALDTVETSLLSSDAAAHWNTLSARLRTGQEGLGQVAEIDRARAWFQEHSTALIEVAQRFGHAERDEIVLAYCPMAFRDRGSYWLQIGREIANPYFGDEMLRCGVVREVLVAAHTVTGGAPE